MLSRDNENAAREVNAFNIAQNLQVCAVQILNLPGCNFRIGRCNSHATSHCDHTSDDRTGYS
jgi:hypothetical protein